MTSVDALALGLGAVVIHRGLLCGNAVFKPVLPILSIRYQGSFPNSRYDGAGLRPYRRDFALFLRIFERQGLIGQDCHDLPTLFRTAVVAISLRLRYESCEGRVIIADKIYENRSPLG